MSEQPLLSRVPNPGFLARGPGAAITAGTFDLKRYSVWVTTGCVWGLALTATLFAAFPALQISGMNPGPTFGSAGVAVVVGAGISLLPWQRWGSDAILIMGLTTVPALAAFNHLSNYSGSSIGVGVVAAEFFCTNAICGLTQRRGVPVVYGMYVGAVFFLGSQLTNDPWVLSVSPFIFIPFTAILGETIAWTVGALRDARRLEYERVDDLQTLSRSIAQLRTDMPVDQAAEIVVSTARQLLRGSHAQLVLRDEPLGRVGGEAAVNEAIDRAMMSNRLQTHRVAESGFDTLCLPLAGESSPWAVIVIWLDRSADDFTLSLAELVTMEAGTALDQLQTIAALSHDATIDTLTGIGNRRVADAALAGMQAGDAIVLVDLDKFKSVNDTLGHAAGDAVIRALGECLSSGRRDTDVVARLGGDEFVWIAKGLGDQSLATGERLRNRWMRTQPLSSISVGIAVHDDKMPPSGTLAAADAALYAAKELGGDHVELSASPPAGDGDRTDHADGRDRRDVRGHQSDRVDIAERAVPRDH